MNKGVRLVNGIALLLNIAGVAAFLLIASSMAWAQRGFEHDPGATVGTFLVWGAVALPLPLGFLLLDFMLLILAAVVYAKRKVWSLEWTFAFVPVMWAVAIYVDNIHH